MKPFYHVGYRNLLDFLLDAKTKRILLLGILFLIVSFFIGSLVFTHVNAVMVFGLFLICVISMIPLRYCSWCGFFDMNTILTVYTTMHFGVPSGLFVGSASLVGIIISGDVDNNLIFDLLASYVIVFVASLFSVSLFLPVVLVCSIVYALIAFLFHSLSGTLDVLNSIWTTTNLVWVWICMLKILPLLGLA